MVESRFANDCRAKIASGFLWRRFSWEGKSSRRLGRKVEPPQRINGYQSARFSLISSESVPSNIPIHQRRNSDKAIYPGKNNITLARSPTVIPSVEASANRASKRQRDSSIILRLCKKWDRQDRASEYYITSATKLRTRTTKVALCSTCRPLNC